MQTNNNVQVCSGKSLPMDLPYEIVGDVLSRIPMKTIVCLNCVCKRWRSILSEEPYFANLRGLRLSSNWPAGLITLQLLGTTMKEECGIYKVTELDDKSDDHHGIYHDHLTSFDPGLVPAYSNRSWSLCGSVNGLICLMNYCGGAACICNPITQEYILLPDREFITKPDTSPTFGFGYVEASNEYKVVCFYEHQGFDNSNSWCEVYTLGIGMWRSLGQVPFLAYSTNSSHTPLLVSGHLKWHGSTDGIFVGGNLHWLVYDQKGTNHERVCTFDLIKEVFQLTATPEPGDKVNFRRLGVLGECLCVCDTATRRSELVMWVMKDYGMKESWNKEIVIRDIPTDLLGGGIHPLKVFKDGTVFLLLSYMGSLFTYDTETKTFKELDIFRDSLFFFSRSSAMVFVPNSIRLKSFMLEKVSVF